MDLRNFYVVTCVSNPQRWQSRYRLYRMFEEMMEAAGVQLITVEMAFGTRPFEVTEEMDPNHLQFRSVDELWHKETMLNLGIQHAIQLNPRAEYFAWVDADVVPVMPPKKWIEETYHALQHYEVVQMFETALDTDPNFNFLGKVQHGFMAQYVKSGYQKPCRGGFWDTGNYTLHGHPGYAWAATRYAIDSLGGLIEAILGAGDRHMALGLVGCIEQSFPDGMTEGYKRELLQWQKRAHRWIREDVGYVPGSIYHYWHGKKKDRGYVDRWKILRDNNFNPAIDVKRDAQGLLQLETHTVRQKRLRDMIRTYFRQRNEDSIDL